MPYPFDTDPYVQPGRYDGLLTVGLLACSAVMVALAAVGAYTVYGWLVG